MTRSSQNPRVLILATSYAPELRRPELRPREYPRTDYVELAKMLDCDVLDYSIYDSVPRLERYRMVERKLRLDFHLAFVGIRRARDYDVVLLGSERVAIPYMMLQRLFGRRAATVYVSAHSSAKQAKLVHALGLFNSIGCAVSNTHAQREFLVADMGIPADRISYVLYAADEQFFTPVTGSRDYVFSAGGIAGRDYPTLFDAVRDSPTRVKVAAGGRFYSPSAQRRLPPIPSNVEMVAPTDSAGMRDLYRGAALVVVPLHADRRDAAGCSVVLEAMCCGKTVVASHTKGMEDYIADQTTGLLAEPSNPGALRECIERATAGRERGEPLGRRARAECEGRLGLNSLVTGLRQAVEEATASGMNRNRVLGVKHER